MAAVYCRPHKCCLPQALTENSNSMAKFASFCQTAGLVPVLSVELLPDGDYDQRQAQDSLRAVLVVLMKALHDYHVYLEVGHVVGFIWRSF